MKFVSYISDTVHASRKIMKMFFRKNKALFVMDIFLGLSTEGEKLVGIIMPAVVIQLIAVQSGFDRVFVFLLFVSGLTAALGIVVQVLQRCRTDYGLRAKNTLYYDLNGKAARLDLKDCEDEEMIDEYYKVFDNIWWFSGVSYEILCNILSRTVSCVLMSYVLISVDWRLFLMIIGIHVMSMLFQARQDESVYRHEEKKSERTKRLKYLKETLYDFEAGRELRIFDSGSWFREKVRHENQQVHEIDLQIQKIKLRYGFLLGMLRCVQLLLIYVVSIQQYRSGYIILSSFVMYVNATRMITDSISSIADSVSFLHNVSFYYKDFEDFLKVKETMRESGSLGQIPEDDEGMIEFRNVSFKYPNRDDYALKDVSFVIKRGEIVSIVGNNGAGKSTLIKLMLRLYDPTEGSILYDGVDIREYEYDFYQSLFAPVFQDYIMYPYTLRENLIFNHGEDEKHIDDALARTGLYHKIKSLGLERSYSKRYYDDGVELSGGEEQRFVIARALCKDAGTLILDEPTAAVDPLAESRLFHEIFHAVESNTVIFISHRMASTRFSDRILVLDQAELVETGTHQELLQNDKVYAEMYHQQADYYI